MPTTVLLQQGVPALTANFAGGTLRVQPTASNVCYSRLVQTPVSAAQLASLAGTLLGAAEFAKLGVGAVSAPFTLVSEQGGFPVGRLYEAEAAGDRFSLALITTTADDDAAAVFVTWTPPEGTGLPADALLTGLTNDVVHADELVVMCAAGTRYVRAFLQPATCGSGVSYAVCPFSWQVCDDPSGYCVDAAFLAKGNDAASEPVGVPNPLFLAPGCPGRNALSVIAAPSPPGTTCVNSAPSSKKPAAAGSSTTSDSARDRVIAVGMLVGFLLLLVATAILIVWRTIAGHTSMTRVSARASAIVQALAPHTLS